MDDDGDFTFCEVAAPVSEERNRLVLDIDGIKINDESQSDSRGKQNSGLISKDEAQDNLASTRQATVESLSFNVSDRSTPKKVSDLVLGDAGSSAKKQELNAGGKKPAARTKVPFEKGYSQMDWLKLTCTHPDLAGVDILMKAVGKDCTSLFNKYHGWVNAEFLLEKWLVGILDENQ